MRTLFVIVCLGLWTSAPAFASLTASPSFVQFFDTPINGFGQSQVIYIQNLGPQAVQVQTSNSCFGDFVVSSFCNLTLGPNQSCSVDIRFQPRQEGQQSCYIQFHDSIGGSAFVNVNGRGVRQH